MIAAAIIGAEIAFWVVLAASLLCRYGMRLTRASTVLLLCLPLVDLALLAFVAVDLAGGTPPRSSHALAATYLGFTVAFGHPLVRWADARVAHHWRGAPLPPTPARGSAARVRALWVEWGRVVLAVVIAGVVLIGLSALSNGTVDLELRGDDPLMSSLVGLVALAGIWFLAGPAFARVDEKADARAPRP